MNNYKINSFFLFITCIFIIAPSYAVSERQEVVDPALFIFSSHEPADNEFPRTVGTVKRETDGFEITWESEDMFGFVDSFTELFNVNLGFTGFFGLFSSDEKSAAKTASTNIEAKKISKNKKYSKNNLASPKVTSKEIKKSANKIQKTKIENKDLTSNTNKQSKLEQPSKLNKLAEIEDLTPQRVDLAEVEDLTVTTSGSEIVENRLSEKTQDISKIIQIKKPTKSDKVAVKEEEPDWRYQRKWWQRGTPVL